jgi:hypothetical protein
VKVFPFNIASKSATFSTELFSGFESKYIFSLSIRSYSYIDIF